MTHFISVGEGLGVQIPPHLLKAAHLDGASDLVVEVMNHGLFIALPKQNYVRNPKSKTIFDLLDTIKIEGPLDIDAAVPQTVLDNTPMMTKKQAIEHLKQFRKEHGKFTAGELQAMKEEGRS